MSWKGVPGRRHGRRISWKVKPFAGLSSILHTHGHSGHEHYDVDAEVGHHYYNDIKGSWNRTRQ
jgi:hypothetical protein